MLNLLKSFEDLNSTWIERNSGCYFDFQKLWQAFQPKAVFKKLSHPGIGERYLVLAPDPWLGGKKQQQKQIEQKGHFSQWQKRIL